MPLPYLARCVALVRQFPRRMRDGDVEFLKNYSFLFVRSRPEVYWFSLVHVARSLAVAVVSIMPGFILQVMSLQVVMFFSLGAVVRFHPWRSRAANVIEIVVISMVMFLCALTSFFGDVTQAERVSIGYFCTVLACLAFLPLPLCVIYLVAIRFAPRRKTFQHFLCHHKAGAGAFVRLLKMSLTESPWIRGQVFVDSDNLENLSSLFDFVSHNTEKLVVVASRHIFRRPWCVGEMTAARIFKVNTVVLVMPDAQLPNEPFIKGYGTEEASSMECLRTENVSLPEVQETLRWILGMPRIEVSLPLGRPMLRTLAAKLCGKDKAADTGKAATSANLQPEHFILCDPSNLEAVAAAYVLQSMLVPHFLKTMDALPLVLSDGEDLDEDGVSVVLLLSVGVLERGSCLQTLIRAADFSMRVLPVLLEDSFRFPPRAELEQLCARAGEVGAVDVVEGILREIGVQFQPQYASQEVLEVGATAIARRIQDNRVMQVTTTRTLSKTVCTEKSSDTEETEEVLADELALESHEMRKEDI